ncbi:MAG: hypothetical protein AAGE76_06660 [Pseudomonadota bacterium]
MRENRARGARGIARMLPLMFLFLFLPIGAVAAAMTRLYLQPGFGPEVAAYPIFRAVVYGFHICAGLGVLLVLLFPRGSRGLRWACLWAWVGYGVIWAMALGQPAQAMGV